MADRKLNFDTQISVDQPLVRVPSELLQKSLRTTRKILDKDFTFFSSQTTTPSNIDQLITRAKQLKRKLNEAAQEEVLIAKRLKTRISHLEQLSGFTSIDDEDFDKWSQLRVVRIIVDYLLRNGYNQSANLLAKTVPSLNELVDVELFESTCFIEEKLKQQSCTECLAWCLENRAALKKNSSSLEFMLRTQEFIELLRVGKKLESIAYARKYFSSFATDANLKEVQQVMTLLVFKPNSIAKNQKYQELQSPERWKTILKQFRSDAYHLYSLPAQSLLSLVLQTGLPPLKTKACYNEEDKNVHCPVCTHPLNDLAKPLPFSHHVTSTIVCRISGEVMDEDNPPMCLPNGNIYAFKSLDKMMKERGYILDPRSGKKFQLNQCKKAFLA